MANALVVYEMPDHTVKSYEYMVSAYGNEIHDIASDYANSVSAVILAISPKE